MGVKSIDRGPLSPAIVLVRPREEGNIGAAARAMANMGLSELVLVDPEAAIGRIARAFAVGAGRILDEARHAPNLAEGLAPYQRIIGTTSARARDLPLPPITPRTLPTALQKEAAGTRTALVFGPEVSGLDNDQLARCGILVRVPCAPVQPTLNLAQAVLVIAYELHTARLAATDATEALPPPVPTDEIDGLFAQLEPLLTEIGFQRDDTFGGVVRDLRRLAARAGVTEREVSILRGICRRAQRALEHR
jgi:TrmH family RNA methyltransferase